MKQKYYNPFTTLLSLLKIKYTKNYSSELFSEHPNKHNLLGLSQMLSEYNIANEGIIVDDKKTFSLQTLNLPFIAQMGTGFAVVTGITDSKVELIINDLNIKIDQDQFRDSWKGILLLVEPNEDYSIEPMWKDHKRESLSRNIKYVLLLGSIFSVLILNLRDQQFGFPWVVLFFLNLCGVFVSCLLLQKQININGRIAEKLCSIFSKGDCNDVLNSGAAQLFGFSWSEIGIGYFIGNLIIICFMPILIPYFAAINLFILPYSIWSIWYQKFKVKQWCVLCLMVQLLLWLIFMGNILFGYLILPFFSLDNIISIGLIYGIPILTINALMSLIAQSWKGEMFKHGFNSLRLTEEVFCAQLKRQMHIDIGLEDSKIIFGNPQAEIRITIFSNPHCNPCARLHKKIDMLLQASNKFCIQYIFCSFGPEWEDSSKHLLAIYLNNEIEIAKSVFNEWFKTGKNDRIKFREKYKMDIGDPYVLEEYNKHLEWGRINNIESTPTVFVNGYLLPDLYKLEDIRYFVDIDL